LAPQVAGVQWGVSRKFVSLLVEIPLVSIQWELLVVSDWLKNLNQ
jgi:hypothetical protein